MSEPDYEPLLPFIYAEEERDMNPSETPEPLEKDTTTVPLLTCACPHDLNNVDTLNDDNDQLVETQENPTPIHVLFEAIKRQRVSDVAALVKKNGRQQEPNPSSNNCSRHSWINTRDAQGHTVMHWGAFVGNVEILDLLFRHQASVDEPSQDGVVELHPIHWACTQGQLEALHWFIHVAGVSINTCDRTKSRTPLLLSAQHGHTYLVMYCLENGANVDLVDDDRDSAIHWAAYVGTTDMLSVFQYLNRSSDVHAVDRYVLLFHCFSSNWEISSTTSS